jgi:hypothetical protein
VERLAVLERVREVFVSDIRESLHPLVLDLDGLVDLADAFGCDLLVEVRRAEVEDRVGDLARAVRRALLW